MEGFIKMREDLDKIIQNDFQLFDDDDDPSYPSPKLDKIDSATPTTPTPTTTTTSPASSSGTPTPNSAIDTPTSEPPPLGDRIVAFFERPNLERFVETNLFQVCIIVLVVLDIIFVILELLLDLNKIYEAVNLGHHESGMAVFFHVISFTILNVFVVEIALKIYIYQLEFLKQKFEMFDALVVLIAWCLDIAFLHSKTAAAVLGFKLIVILRLWRVARIINGIIQGLRTRNKAKLKKEKEMQGSLSAEVEKLKSANSKLEAEVAHLRNAARKYGVPESSLQRLRSTSENAGLEGGVSVKKPEVVVQMTQESEYL